MAKYAKMDAIECIPKRPSMFISSVDQKGVEHLAKELVANGIDLFLRNQAQHLKIKTRHNKISIFDNGSGLPFSSKSEYLENSLAHQYLTEYHNSATSDGHAPHVHLQFIGAGMAVVNALSEELVVESFQNNQKWTLVYKKGRLENSHTEEKMAKVQLLLLHLTVLFFPFQKFAKKICVALSFNVLICFQV